MQCDTKTTNNRPIKCDSKRLTNRFEYTNAIKLQVNPSNLKFRRKERTVMSIESQQSDAVLTLSLTRLDKLNALTRDMYAELTSQIVAAEENNDINVIVIQGNAQCFTAGNDLADFMKAGELDDAHPTVKFLKAVASMKKPLLVAVAGPAVGIGTTLLLHADHVIAANNTRLRMPFVSLGLCPEFASSYLLPLHLGYQRAAELLLFGDEFSADKALEMGIVSRVVSEDELLPSIQARAIQLAKLPPNAVQVSKQLLKKGLNDGINAAFDAELAAFGKALKSEECQTIISGFFNRK